MNNEDLTQYECGLFADRDTLGEALEYANHLAKTTENPIVTLTAVHVVLNTVLRIMQERELEVVDDDGRSFGPRI